MTVTVTPTAIDAFVRIESIRVVDRHRMDLGDLRELADSIADVGLLNPLTLTREGRLVAGQRRLEACRLLGWSDAPVRFIDSLDDAAKLLRAERDENICRKEMLPSERVALAKSLEEMEKPRAAQRQHEARVRAGKIRQGTFPASCSGEQDAGNARDIAARAAGLSPTSYYKAKTVVELANDPTAHPDLRRVAQVALADMDGTGNVASSYAKVNEARRELSTIVEQPEIDAEWLPTPNDSSIRATARRRELIQAFAAAGYTSRQIGERLLLNPATIRRIARDIGLAIPADEALGKGRRRIDSNRIVRETVHALEGLAMAVALVRVDELDPAEIREWALSLTKSTQAVNQLVKSMKEKARE